MGVGYRRTSLIAARKAAGYTQEGLAGALFVDRSTVIRWEAGDNAPWPYLWPKLARLLHVAPSELHLLIGEQDDRHEDDGRFYAAFAWLDEHAGWASGTGRRKVSNRIRQLDARTVLARNVRRARVTRSQLVDALATYYGDSADGCDLYRARCDGREVATSVATQADWLNTARSLDKERFAFRAAVPDGPSLELNSARDVVNRLAEASTLDVRMTDTPLYRLLDVNPHSLSGTFALAPFTDYALTVDLLEAELTDAIVSETPTRQGNLPLRDVYLPDLAAVLNPASRLCAGGVLALCAIARPATDGRSEPDYVLLTQQRSEQVLNAPGRLAVIPKGFHQPLSDPRADVRISATLRRDLEEELFARADLDPTLGASNVAEPMHETRLSEPMRWLRQHDALRMDCTGFGYNLVSGNYEFACLVVIEDEEFWSRYGGTIEANWQTVGLRQYSSRDRAAIADLAADKSWSNEGLFALLQGIRRLKVLSGNRVNLPDVEQYQGKV